MTPFGGFLLIVFWAVMLFNFLKMKRDK